MKKLIILIFLFVFLSFNSNAEIAYIDMNLILKESKIGESLNNHIRKIKDEHISKYKKIEKNLVKKEKVLINQQNIMDKNEFEKKLTLLSEEIKTYRKEKKNSENELNKIRIENTKKILEILNPIITNFVENNAILIVLPKKNIIVGKKSLDITNQIISLLNNSSGKLNF